MPSPSFSVLNGQIKTAWRWYDAEHKLAQYQPGCRDEVGICDVPSILSAPDELPPFQFPRPSSVLGITSWKLFDIDGNELADLAAEIALIEIQAFSTFDYLIYPGTILSTPLSAGTYYSQIVTNGNTYYSEPFKVICELEDVTTCYRRLDWTSCGNVGNTYFAGGFTDEYWLDLEKYPMLPQPANTIESEEQADGTIVETFRRKEVRYTIRMGFVPWPVADALTDLPLMGTVRLHHTGDDGFDTLREVRADVRYVEGFSECMPQVDLSFLIDNTAVACCDDFDPPCLAICVDAFGFVSEVDAESNGNYLNDVSPHYIEYLEGVTGTITVCESGAANIIQDEVEAITHGEDKQTYLWNIQTESWVPLATIDAVTSTTVGSDCEVLVTATIINGYSGILQFYNGFSWTDSDFGTLTDTEWLGNTTAWIKQTGAQFVRMRVVIGNCEIGFSAAWPTNVSCP